LNPTIHEFKLARPHHPPAVPAPLIICRCTNISSRAPKYKTNQVCTTVSYSRRLPSVDLHFLIPPGALVDMYLTIFERHMAGEDCVDRTRVGRPAGELRTANCELHRLRTERCPAVRSPVPVVARRFLSRPIIKRPPCLTVLLQADGTCFWWYRRNPSSVNHPREHVLTVIRPAARFKSTSPEGHRSHKSHKSDYMRPAVSSSHVFVTIQHYHTQMLPPTTDHTRDLNRFQPHQLVSSFILSSLHIFFPQFLSILTSPC
jgi:hypothetical protein